MIDLIEYFMFNLKRNKFKNSSICSELFKEYKERSSREPDFSKKVGFYFEIDNDGESYCFEESNN